MTTEGALTLAPSRITIEYKIGRFLNTEILVSLYLQSCMMVSKGFTLQFIYFLVFPTPYEILKSTSFKK